MDASRTESLELKSSKIARMAERHDWLSNLPQDIFYHILSFLTTLEVVRTSVLAKKWKDVWTQFPCLHFDDSDFSDSNREDGFVNFVSRFHDLYKSPTVKSYFLDIQNSRNALLVDDWVRFAVQKNVSELKVIVQDSINSSKPFEMPCCESMKELTLALSGRALKLNATGIFSLLESLHLSELKFDANTIFSASSHRFPVLKSLRFMKCSGLYKVDVDLPLLDELIISKCSGLDQLSVCGEKLRHLLLRSSFCSKGSMVKILAPNIQEFDWFDYIVHNFFFRNSTCLRMAYVLLLLDFVPPKTGYDESAMKLMNSLACAESIFLELTFFVNLSAHRAFLEGLASPQNIKQMSVVARADVHIFRKISYIFRICSNLEVLVIKTLDDQTLQTITSLGKFLRSIPADGENSAGPFQSQPIGHLKRVDFKMFRGKEFEIEFVGFLLENSVALERLNILFEKDVDLSSATKDAVAERVMGLPRASADVVLTVD